jgi:hypothetical protein
LTPGRCLVADAEDEYLFRVARLGVEARRVFGADIATYLENRAQQDRLNALRKLEDVSPCDSVTIARLQVEALAAAKALTWIENVISEGEAAEGRLREKDEIDNGY